MKIKKLNESHKSFVANIASECFADDKYFDKVSIDRETKKLELYKIYEYGFYITQKHGENWGIFNDDNLIGFAMMLDYIKLKKDNKAYGKIFPVSNINNNDYDVNKFVEKVDTLINPKYLLAICVLPQFQRQGFGTELVSFIVERYKGHIIVSDVDNVSSLSIYRKFNFDIEQLNQNYYFILKN